MSRGWKTMQQQELWGSRVSSLAIKHLKAVYLSTLVSDGCHPILSFCLVVQSRMSSGADRMDCFVNNVDDEPGRCNDWRVIDGMRPDLRVHALGHKALGLRDNHAIMLGD